MGCYMPSLSWSIFNDCSKQEVAVIALLSEPASIEELSFNLSRSPYTVRKWLRALRARGLVETLPDRPSFYRLSSSLTSQTASRFIYPFLTVHAVGGLDNFYLLLCLLSIRGGSSFGHKLDDQQVYIAPKRFSALTGFTLSSLKEAIQSCKRLGWLIVKNDSTGLRLSLKPLLDRAPSSRQEAEKLLHQSLFYDPIFLEIRGSFQFLGRGPCYRLLAGRRYYLESLEQTLESLLATVEGREAYAMLPQAVLKVFRTPPDFQDYVVLFRDRLFYLGPRESVNGKIDPAFAWEIYRPASPPVYQSLEGLPKVFSANSEERLSHLWDSLFRKLGPKYFPNTSKISFLKVFMPYPKTKRRYAKKNLLLKILKVLEECQAEIEEFTSFVQNVSLKRPTLNYLASDQFLEIFKTWKKNYKLLVRLVEGLKFQFSELSVYDTTLIRLFQTQAINEDTLGSYIAFVLSKPHLPKYALASTSFLKEFYRAHPSRTVARNSFLSKLRGYLYNSKSDPEGGRQKLSELFCSLAPVDQALIDSSGRLTRYAIELLLCWQKEGKIEKVSLREFLEGCLSEEAMEVLS